MSGENHPDRRACDFAMMDLLRQLNDVYANCAVLEEKCTQLHTRCGKQDAKIEVLQAFSNKAIGYAAAVAFAVSLARDYIG